MTEVPILVTTREPQALTAGISDTDVYIEANDGNVVVQAYNPTGGDITVEYVREATLGGEALPNQEETVAAGETVWLGPFPPFIFNDETARVHILDSTGSLVFNGLRF